MRHIPSSLGFLLSVLFVAPVLANDEPPTRSAPRDDWSRQLEATAPHAAIRDRFFLGTGQEQRTRLASGGLRVQRVKRYTHVEHPETGAVARLPEPCRVVSEIDLDRSLRLVRLTERMHIPRSIDAVFEDYAFTEEHAELFTFDEARVRRDRAGTHLTRTTLRRGNTVEQTSYAYESDDVPVEILGIALARHAARGARRFDFDLLMPDGATHRVATDVHHAQNLQPFGTDYRFPASVRRHLALRERAAVLEMELASPVKRLLYPYKFYLAYVPHAPADPVAFWGGKPGSHLYAFRTDGN